MTNFSYAVIVVPTSNAPANKINAGRFHRTKILRAVDLYVATFILSKLEKDLRKFNTT